MIGITLAAALQFVCGTGAETQRQAIDVDKRVRARTRVTSLSTTDAPPSTRFANETLFVRADEETVPFDKPADLEGLSLHFTRRSAMRFAVARTALQYDDDIGPLFVEFGRGAMTKQLPLPFAFPFGDATHDSVTLSVTRGIHFTPDPSLPSQWIRSFTALTDRTPLLSPLYDRLNTPAGRPLIYVRTSSDAVTITWRNEPTSRSQYDLQAVLHRNGDVRFSYRKLQNVAWGGVVVSTGSDAWLRDRATLLHAFDAPNDVDPNYGAQTPMLDIRSLEVSRVGQSSMLEFRFHLGAPLDRDVLDDDVSYTLYLGDSLNRAELFVQKRQLVYRISNQPEAVNSNAARIEGADVVLNVTEELFALPGRSVKVWAYSNDNTMADAFETTLNLGPAAPRAAEIDFSDVDAFEADRPLVETYKLATLNVYGVWNRLQNEFGYRNDDVDAVAIYTTFDTDIILSSHGAFATLANPGVDGISQFSSKAQPRTPTLMHMNSLIGIEPANRVQTLLHELGHRWLYYFEIREEGANTRSLNPLGYHPAGWVHTPGAFVSDDSSPMGGAAFTDHGNGTFTSAPQAQYLGYTWHELYLMGLARVAEVQPWWYLRDTTTLPAEYYPPVNTTVNATRVDVGVQQVIDAMGPRDPSFESSQKTFRVLFVVVTRDGSSIDLPFRTTFESQFAESTGGRGQVITTVSVAPPVANFTFENGAFTDATANVPLEWTWDFGDGATSHARNPRHAYAAPGTYAVTLTVRNGKGTASVTKFVTVNAATRRRAVRK